MIFFSFANSIQWRRTVINQIHSKVLKRTRRERHRRRNLALLFSKIHDSNLRLVSFCYCSPYFSWQHSYPICSPAKPITASLRLLTVLALSNPDERLKTGWACMALSFLTMLFSGGLALQHSLFHRFCLCGDSRYCWAGLSYHYFHYSSSVYFPPYGWVYCLVIWPCSIPVLVNGDF